MSAASGLNAHRALYLQPIIDAEHRKVTDLNIPVCKQRKPNGGLNADPNGAVDLVAADGASS